MKGPNINNLSFHSKNIEKKKIKWKTVLGRNSKEHETMKLKIENNNTEKQ